MGIFNFDKTETDFDKTETEIENRIYKLKNEWVYKFYNSQLHKYYYNEYLNEFFDKNHKDGIVDKEKEINLLSFDDFEAKRVKEAEDKRQALLQKKIKKLANQKNKGRLTNAERYLIRKSGLNVAIEYNDMTGSSEVDNLKTDAELKMSIKKMRQRKKYKALKDLDLKLRNLERPITFKSFGDFTSDELRELCYWERDNLKNFIIAENDIEGMTEEEIKQHALLEEL